MPIVGSDIKYVLSGGAANTNPNLSLGGAISTDPGGVIPTAVKNNVFDDVSGDEAGVGDTEYRGIYVKNAHGSLTLQNAKVWIDTNTTSIHDEIDIALAGEGLDGTMETIANESTAPVGEAFTHPATKATGLSLGSIPAGQKYGVWIRRVVQAGAAALTLNSGIIRVEGDTAP